jgi:hypothetical protein
MHPGTGVHAITGGNAGDMDEAGVTGNLEPEIPVLEQIQVLVETATQIDDLAPEKYRMQWHQVARKQAQFVERQINGAPLGCPSSSIGWTPV